MRCYTRIIDRVFPPGTLTRKLFDYQVLAVKTLLKSGPREVCRKSGKFIAAQKHRRAFREAWLRSQTLGPGDLAARRSESDRFPFRPKFSIIQPVYNPRLEWLRSAIESVASQCYPVWELNIVDDASPDPEIRDVIREYAAKDGRIRPIFLPVNSGVAGASNHALSAADGAYVVFLDHDDLFTPDAFYEVAKELNREKRPDFIYSDELLVNGAGMPLTVLHKPDLSMDYFLSHPYIVHLVAVRTDLIRQAGGFRTDFVVSQDYDLFLRILGSTKNVAHIPKVLYHWRQHRRSAGHAYLDRVSSLSRRAIGDYLAGQDIDAEVLDTENFNVFRVKRKISRNSPVSIIIPTRDRADLLETCIESILQKSTYTNFEIIVVDNMSREPQTKEYLGALSSNPRIRVIGFGEEFNFSRVNNFAAASASGEHLLFLNNDVKVIDPDWIEALLEHSQRDDVGCVGAKLLYPDDTIQHAGVVIGLCGPAEHVYKFWPADDIGYMEQLVSIRNYSAVTGACMMMRKSVFEDLGGFDEQFRIGFGDTDLCLRAGVRGLATVYTPYARLYHFESATRGKTYGEDSHPGDTARFRERWRLILEKGDPMYNPNLPLDTLHLNSRVQMGFW